jgi:hypothetical protein
MDEVIRQDLHWQPHTNTLTTIRTQPTQELILDRNREIRENDLMGDLSFGRQIASIPMNMWEEAIRDGFSLNHPDREIGERELHRFLQSPKGKQCLLQEKRQKYWRGGSTP